MPNNTKTRVGETKIARNGMKMTIIAYHRCDNIDIQFEDDTVIKHKTYQAFKLGKIKNPNIVFNKKLKSRIGETRVARNGLPMTIINYRQANDIDIQFSDGTVIYHKSYKHFKQGNIAHPDINVNTQKQKTKRIGQTKQAANGMKMTIVKYYSSHNIEIQFEDGYTTRNTYKGFLTGHVKHPKKHGLLKSKIGETAISTNGLKMTILDYKQCNHIDVQFEDGFIVFDKTYSNFKKGNIAHPFPFLIGIISVDKPAFVYDDNGNFFCHCIKCGHIDIMDMLEIHNHTCITRDDLIDF